MGGHQIPVKGLRVDSYGKVELTPLISRKRVEVVGAGEIEGRDRKGERGVREMEWSNISAIKIPFNITISSSVSSSI